MSEHDDRAPQSEPTSEPRGQSPEPERQRERGAHAGPENGTPREGASSTDAGVTEPLASAVPPGPVRSSGRDEGSDDDTVALPDWREPPTGDVPRVLEELSGIPVRDLGGPRTGELPSIDDETVPWSPPPPTQGERSKLDDDARPRREPSEAATPRAPRHHRRRRDGGEGEATTQDAGVERRTAAGSRRRGGVRGATPGDERSHGAPARSKALSTLTGVALAAIVVVALVLGRIPLLVVVALALELAASEAFSVLHRGGLLEARFLGLAGVGALIGVAYAYGPAGDGGVVVAAFVLGAAWYVLGPLRRPAYEGLSHTLGVVVWVGLLGSYAAVLLRPATFHGHGELVLVVAIATTVADDTAAFFVGSVLGRHRLAPRISPNKTIEGLIGGTVAAIVAGALLGMIAPLSVVEGAILGLVVAVVAPLGDLLESAFKRQFHVKDSGALLPGHGGVLDRIDAMLVVLPASYYLFAVMHLR